MYWTKAMCRRLVMYFRAKGRPFTFQEMYEKGPGDLDLYDVVSDLVKKGLINGPDPMDPDTNGGHDDWTYTANKSHPRIFVEWENGAFVNSEDASFQEVLVKNTTKYGPPATVEFRCWYEGPTLAMDADDFLDTLVELRGIDRVEWQRLSDQIPHNEIWVAPEYEYRDHEWFQSDAALMLYAEAKKALKAGVEPADDKQ